MSEERTPEPKSEYDGKISLTIRFATDDEVVIKVKKTTAFAKVYAGVGKSKGIDEHSFQLMRDGTILRREETAKMLEFDNEEIIDCLIKQIGGGSN